LVGRVHNPVIYSILVAFRVLARSPYEIIGVIDGDNISAAGRQAPGKTARSAGDVK